MLGTSSLTIYAGQQITLAGVGALLVTNYAALLQGSGTLSTKAAVTGRVALSGSGYLQVAASGSTAYGRMAPLRSVGSMSWLTPGPVEVKASGNLVAGEYVALIWVVDHFEAVHATSATGIAGYVVADVLSGNYGEIVLGGFTQSGSTYTVSTSVAVGEYVYVSGGVAYAANAKLESTSVDGYLSGATTITPGYFTAVTAGPVQYGFGYGVMRPATSYAYAYEYIPPVLVTGFGVILPTISNGAITLSNPGSATGYVVPAISRGGDFRYGVGYATVAPAISYGYYGDDETYLVSFATPLSSFVAAADIVIVLTSTGTIVSSFTAQRTVIEQMMSNLVGASVLTMEVDALAELWASVTARSVDSAAVGTRAPLEGKVWVVNLDTTASSQYDDYGFDSFITHEGRQYGVATDGIYLLEGETDNGEDIESLVDFGITDCGVPSRKKVPIIKIGTTDGLDMYLSVASDSGTRNYKLEKSKAGGYFWRVVTPHTQQGVYWRFVLSSSRRFELSSVDFQPAKLTRRI